MKTLALVIIALALAAPGASQEKAAPAALPSVALPPELDRVLRDYEKAWRAKDAEALSNLFAENGFVLANGELPVRGRPAIRQAYSGAGGPLHLRALAFGTGNDVGYIIGGYAEAPDAPDIGKFTLVLERNREGRWLILSDMDNPNRRRAPAQPAQPAPTGTTPPGN